MKKTFIRIYTIFISLIFIFALSFFGVNTYKLYINGQKNAKNRLDNMCLRIKMISPEIEFSSYEFNERMISAIDNKSDFASLIIKIDNKEYYKYPSTQTKQIKKSALIKTDSKNFKLNQKNISIYAEIYILQPKQILSYLKYSLLIVIFATILTAVLILIDNNTKEAKEIKKNELEREIDELLPGTHAIIETNPSENIVKNEVIEEKDNEQENITQSNIFETNESERHEDFVNSIMNNNPKYAAKKIVDKETNEYQNKLNSNSELSLPSEEIKPMKLNQNPEGLFSPKTGFGWESYLLTRLENELNRATASEIDLALFIIKISELEKLQEKLPTICNVISTHFQFKDLIFEYKNDSIVALKLGTNSEQAFNFAEKLLIDLSNIINGESKTWIGISTKTIRIISGERLLNEASEALNHAMEDENSPIVAFKADADKYRQFIDNN